MSQAITQENTTERQYSIQYPRRATYRRAVNAMCRLILKTMTNTTVTGLENIPQKGPMILVGNHVAMMEVVMMIAYPPHIVEMIGTGDIPMRLAINPLVYSYKFIPIKRGSMDRIAMKQALDVLKQDGVIGMFPEGGIWQANLKSVHTGVSWLSAKGNAPIVPIGFGGTKTAINDTFLLKRPRLTMNVGQPIPPIQENLPGMNRKEALIVGAETVMERIEALVPEDEKTRNEIADEEFELTVELWHDDKPIDVPPELAITHAQALAKFFHRRKLIETLAYNLKVPVRALQRLRKYQTNPRKIANAAQAALDYIDNENPYYLTYRFGNNEGNAMRSGIAELRDLAIHAAGRGQRLVIRGIRRYREIGSGETHKEEIIS